MNLKGILKALKLNESTLSMVLGALVILVIGVLVINYFRNLDKGEVSEGTTTTTETPQPRVIRGEGSVTYTVLAGETLWAIAEKQYGSGYNWVDIATENNLANAGLIETGQVLTIPDVEPKKLTAKEVLVEEELAPISGATYTVLHGDSLWKIAVRAYGDGYKWVDIAQENQLVNPNIIHAGNVLTLPR